MNNAFADIPLGLVEHELGHLFGGLLSGAAAGRIWHDGTSWRCDLEWPVEQPSEEQVTAPHIVGTLIRGDHASGEDRLIAAVVPQRLRDVAEKLAIAVREELDKLGRIYIGDVKRQLLDHGTFTLQRWQTVH